LSITSKSFNAVVVSISPFLFGLVVQPYVLPFRSYLTWISLWVWNTLFMMTNL